MSGSISSRSLDEPRKEHIVANNKMLVESDKIENKATKISQKGINLIKQFEGLKLHSYKLQGEDYYTIGYGHTGPSVKPGQTITEEEAEKLLVADLEDFTNFVVSHCEYLNINQNELDALVSFTYNAGYGNLKKLTANGTRSKEEIAAHITAYTKSKSEVNRNGLQKRRNAEKEMFEAEL